ncbi:MAG: hypothetical protein Q4E11_06500 [Corynebacterium sp.]|uniref:hypothetical protein n=1 Tax=Corynebacterium sp. TaxID=1720 RepID=UPI0026DD1685|nr:hypothetical protein [Corynebacterium sp.]MDO5030221.1 hypothetical protein [Corynebacterium sp.]
MDSWVIFTIASVALGFVMFGTAYMGFMKKWKPAVIWVLGLAALLFATVIPVIIALGYASSTSM